MSDGQPRPGLPALPIGFVWIAASGALAAAEVGLEPALRARALLDPGGIGRALATASGAQGRARTAQVSLPADAGTLVVRGLRRGGLLGPLLGAALTGPGRPFRELCATAALHAAGAPVPQPAFAMAWRRGLAWHAAFATHLEAETVDAEAYLRSAPSPRRLAHGLAAAGRAVRRFHDAGGSHADLHAKNLLVRERGESVEVLVIDLDRARVGSALAPAPRMAQLMRLYRSLRKRGLLAAAGNERGCTAFLRAYTAGDRGLRRALLARLPAERRRVALHALLYR